jgi:cytochrome P450
MRSRNLKLAPGPRGFTAILGVLGERRRNPLDLYRRLVRDYGDFVYFRVGSIGYALVNDPGAVRWVMQENPEGFPKGPGYDRLRSVVGNGLLTSKGELWRKQRRLSAPAFHHQKIAAACDEVVRLTRRMHAEWEEKLAPSMRLDLAAEMGRVALNVAGQTLLGSDTGPRAREIREALHDALKFSEDRGLGWLRLIDVLWPGRDRNLAFAIERRLPTRANMRFRGSLTTLDSVVAQIIEERRKSGQCGGDLLGSFMHSRGDGDCTRMTDAQLRDEVATMLLAGHETTATAMTWTWMLLARNPGVADRLCEEVDRVLGDRVPAFEDLARLEYTRQVFEEAIRCYPPFWRFTRQARADSNVMGYDVPAGTVMIISPFILHRNARFWREPERFDPGRFASGVSQERPKFSYIPFGAGPRACIAASFAAMEALTVIAMTARRYRFGLPEEKPVELEMGVTLRPKGGLPVTVGRR